MHHATKAETDTLLHGRAGTQTYTNLHCARRGCTLPRITEALGDAHRAGSRANYGTNGGARNHKPRFERCHVYLGGQGVSQAAYLVTTQEQT